jgi:hypothetical protein
MRLLALHDAHGNLAGLVAAPSDAPQASFSPEPGLFLSEVDSTGLDLCLGGEETLERLTEVLDHHRVDIATRRLVRAVDSEDSRRVR